MPLAHTGSVSLAYTLFEGEPGSAGAPPLVLVHGLAASAAAWRPVVPWLRSRGAVLTYDLRGHGGSSDGADPAATSLSDLAGDLRGLLLALRIERAHVLGHSLGGLIALDLALQHPAAVASLILVSTTPEADPAGPATERGERPLASASATTMGVERGLVRSARLPLGSGIGHRAVRTAGTGGPREAANALITRPNLTPLLSGICVPVLVIAGEHDPALIQRGAELLHSSIGDSRLMRIAGAGHHGYRERPESFVEIVRSFIREVDTPVPASG